MKTSELDSMMASGSPLLRRGLLLLKHEGLGAFPFAKARSAAYLIGQALKTGVDLSLVADRSSGSWGMALVNAVCAIGDGETRDIAIITVGQPDPFVRASILGAGGRIISVSKNEERISKLNVLVAEGYWTPDQHANELLVEAFENTLGREIISDLAAADISINDLGYVIAPVGTGATLAGVVRALRTASPEARFASVGVDGMWSILHDGPQVALRGDSRAAGVGSLDERCATFQYARQWIDEVVGVDSFRAQEELTRAFKLVPAGFGMSSAYALSYARNELLNLAAAMDPPGHVLVLLPDGIARYGKELAAANDLLIAED